MSKAISPNHREALTAISDVTANDEYLHSNNHALDVNIASGGSIGMFTLPYDEIDATYPNGTTEVYVSKLASITQQTVTVTYTDSTKDFISTVVRS